MRRLATLRNILAAQRQLHRTAEWEVAALRREEAAIAAAQQDVLHALASDAVPASRLVEALSRRLSSLSAEAARIAEARAARERRLVEQALKVKRAERLLARVERSHHQVRERKELEQLVALSAGSAR